MIRTFIAVKLRAEAPLRNVLAQLAGLGKAVRAVDPENLHITLKFLGDTEEELVPRIGQSLTVAAGAEQPFELKIRGLGAFPQADRPSVIWAGLADAESLVRLAAELNASLLPLGFVPEERPFRPHLTLARVKFRPPRELAGILSEHQETLFGAERVEVVELIQSELRPGGSHYTTLHTARLGS